MFVGFLHLYALKHTMKSTQNPFHASIPLEITLKQQILAVHWSKSAAGFDTQHTLILYHLCPQHLQNNFYVLPAGEIGGKRPKKPILVQCFSWLQFARN